MDERVGFLPSPYKNEKPKMYILAQIIGGWGAFGVVDASTQFCSLVRGDRYEIPKLAKQN